MVEPFLYNAGVDIVLHGVHSPTSPLKNLDVYWLLSSEISTSTHSLYLHCILTYMADTCSPVCCLDAICRDDKQIHIQQGSVGSLYSVVQLRHSLS